MQGEGSINEKARCEGRRQNGLVRRFIKAICAMATSRRFSYRGLPGRGDGVPRGDAAPRSVDNPRSRVAEIHLPWW